MDAFEDTAWTLLVGFFYLPVALGCFIWLYFLGEGYLVWSRVIGQDALQSVVVGLLVGGGVALCLRFFGTRPMFRDARADLNVALGLRPWLVVVYWAFSQAIGEELLFRAVAQPQLGVGWSTFLFVLVHVPISKRTLFTPALALVTGLIYAGLYELTGSALASMIAHFCVASSGLRLATSNDGRE